MGAPENGLSHDGQTVVRMQGYLMKQADHFKDWRPRFFLLEGNKFLYFREKGQKLAGFLLLDGCRVSDPVAREKYATFSVIGNRPDQGSVKWRLSGPMAIACEWADALREAANAQRSLTSNGDDTSDSLDIPGEDESVATEMSQTTISPSTNTTMDTVQFETSVPEQHNGPTRPFERVSDASEDLFVRSLKNETAIPQKNVILEREKQRKKSLKTLAVPTDSPQSHSMITTVGPLSSPIPLFRPRKPSVGNVPPACQSVVNLLERLDDEKLGWSLRRVADGVRVFGKESKMTSGMLTKSIIHIDAPPCVVFNALWHVDGRAEWDPFCSEAKLVKRVDKHSDECTVTLDFPVIPRFYLSSIADILERIFCLVLFGVAAVCCIIASNTLHPLETALVCWGALAGATAIGRSYGRTFWYPSGRQMHFTRYWQRNADGSYVIAECTGDKDASKAVDKQCVKAKYLVNGYSIRPVTWTEERPATILTQVSSVEWGGWLSGSSKNAATLSYSTVVSGLRDVALQSHPSALKVYDDDSDDDVDEAAAEKGPLVPAQTDDGSGLHPSQGEGSELRRRASSKKKNGGRFRPIIEETKANVLKFAEDDFPGFKFLKDTQDVKIYRDDSSAVQLLKGIGIIDAPVDKIIALLTDVTRRKDVDTMIRMSKNVEDVDETTRVTYVAFKPVFPTSARDMVHVTYWETMEDGRTLLLARSVEHEEAPEVSRHVRGEILNSGWVFQPEGDKTLAKYIVQVDLKGSIPSSITAMVSTKQPLTIDNVRKVLAKDG